MPFISAVRCIITPNVAGSLRKQGLGPIVQQNQEFSIQNEDFPALPGFKGSYICLYRNFYAFHPTSNDI